MALRGTHTRHAAAEEDVGVGVRLAVFVSIRSCIVDAVCRPCWILSIDLGRSVSRGFADCESLWVRVSPAPSCQRMASLSERLQVTVWSEECGKWPSCSLPGVPPRTALSEAMTIENSHKAHILYQPKAGCTIRLLYRSRNLESGARSAGISTRCEPTVAGHGWTEGGPGPWLGLARPPGSASDVSDRECRMLGSRASERAPRRPWAAGRASRLSGDVCCSAWGSRFHRGGEGESAALAVDAAAFVAPSEAGSSTGDAARLAARSTLGASRGIDAALTRGRRRS